MGSSMSGMSDYVPDFYDFCDFNIWWKHSNGKQANVLAKIA